MRSVNFSCSLIISTALLSSAAIACERPSAPTMPDPETAVRAEVLTAAKQVKHYVAAANKFLGCTRNNRRHDKVADEMNEIVFLYNEVAITYKSRRITKKAVATR